MTRDELLNSVKLKYQIDERGPCGMLENVINTVDEDWLIWAYNRALEDAVESMDRDQEVNYDPRCILKLKI